MFGIEIGVDLAVVIVFLVSTLVIGIYKGMGVKTIEDFALGNRSFSTSTLTATIVATWVSGGFLVLTISEVYKSGMWFAIAASGEIFALLITGLLIGPKIKKFFGNLSVAETMGNLFGDRARLITAIACVIYSTGWLAVQVKVFSMIFSYFFLISSLYATIISSFIVIIYSAFGGIRSVTFTDVFQFIVFGVFIPLFAIFSWKSLGNTDQVLILFRDNQSFDYTQLYNFQNPELIPFVFLFLYFCVPDLSGPIFQRLLMAKDTKQIKTAFSLAAVISVVIHFLYCFIAIVIFAHDSNLEVDSVVMNIINTYFSPAIKGLSIAGILALIMSTADSHLNSGSVIFAHDICKPLGLKAKNELTISRVFSVVSGAGAVYLALYIPTLLDLALLASNFYMPVITVPLTFAILGFRTTFRVFIISMISGIVTVIIWRWQIQDITGIDSVIPGLFANFLAFFSSHYILGEAGGWGGNREKKQATCAQKKSFNQKFKDTLNNIYKCNPLEWCNAGLPASSVNYIYFSIAVFSTMIVTLSIDNDLYHDHFILVNALQAVVLTIATLFFCNGLWRNDFGQKYLGIIWYISIFIGLAVISSFLVLLSKFSHMSLMILTIHLTMISLLVGWRTAIVMISAGLWISFFFYERYIGEMVTGEIYDLKLKMIYVLVMVAGFAITILRSKQEHLEQTEHKVGALETEAITKDGKITILNKEVGHYSERVSNQAREIERLGATAQKILNNVNHELRLPVGNVMNFAEMLRDGLGTFSDKQLKMISEEVYTNSNRLSSMILNMLDLATLNAKKIELKKEKVNFSKLIHERVEKCREIYAQDKKALKFKLDVPDDLIVFADINYIRQMIDNLVINAINFSEQGTISISAEREEYFVDFVIKDEGKGIPKTEIYDIFTPFKMGSNTESKAEGRGVGLALCKSVIEAHDGEIEAESHAVGALFRVCLPYGK